MVSKKGKIKEKLITIIMSYIERHQLEIAQNENQFKEFKIALGYLVSQSPKDLIYCYSKISIPNPCLVLYMQSKDYL